MKVLAQQLAHREHGVDIRGDGEDDDGGDCWSSALCGPLPSISEPENVINNPCKV